MTRPRAALLAALIAAALVAACERSPRSSDRQSSLVVPDCYTVTPFQPIRIAKAVNDAPASHDAMLGAWGGGAWDGAVCHDLWIMSVDAGGKAMLFDAHGPGFHPDATAFTRRGDLGSDGRLRVRQGPAVVEYWVEGDRLHGTRRVGTTVQRIILTRKS